MAEKVVATPRRAALGLLGQLGQLGQATKAKAREYSENRKAEDLTRPYKTLIDLIGEAVAAKRQTSP